MSYDALFQLGTGSGSLSTSQTEETFAARIETSCARAIARGGRQGRAFRSALLVDADHFCAAWKSGGNSAKALISHVGPAAAPSKS